MSVIAVVRDPAEIRAVNRMIMAISDDSRVWSDDYLTIGS